MMNDDSLICRYSYSVETTQINLESICSQRSLKYDTEYGKDKWKKVFGSGYGLPLQIIRRFQQIHQTDISEEKICERYLSAGIAVVKFQLAGSNVLVLKKQLRSTLGEQFSAFAKIRSILSNQY